MEGTGYEAGNHPIDAKFSVSASVDRLGSLRIPEYAGKQC